MEHVIIVGQAGHVKAMHNDKFPLNFLGTQHIERASDIRFDTATQSWGIWFNVGGEFVEPRRRSHKHFMSYEGARKWEVEVVNRALALGVCPSTID